MSIFFTTHLTMPAANARHMGWANILHILIVDRNGKDEGRWKSSPLQQPALNWVGTIWKGTTWSRVRSNHRSHRITPNCQFISRFLHVLKNLNEKHVNLLQQLCELFSTPPALRMPPSQKIVSSVNILSILHVHQFNMHQNISMTAFCCQNNFACVHIP